MARARKAYAPEFKLQAVAMSTDQRRSVAEVARRLGVGDGLLHAWKTAARKTGVGPFPGSGHLTPSRRRTAASGPRSSGWRRRATS